MAIQVFTAVKNRQLDFSVEFQNSVFAILPAVCALLVFILIFASNRAWRLRSAAGVLRRKAFAGHFFMIAITALHAVSLALYFQISNKSEFRTPLSAAAYILRLVSASFITLSTISSGSDVKFVKDLYFLATCILDGIRVHTLWVATNEPASMGIALPAAQTAIVALTVVSLVYSEFQSYFDLRSSRKIGGKAHVDQPGSGTLTVLSFGWLWPLLSYGHKNKINANDIKSSVIPPAAMHELADDWRATVDDGKFYSEYMMQFFFAVVIQMLSAGATLAQPFIVQGITTYLQSEKQNSFGAWLIVAMVLDQLAISLLEAHGSLAFSQLSVRIRSFLVHKVALRSLEPSAPTGGWSSASGKLLVHVSQDAAAVSGAVSMIGMIVPNFFIVSIGSYMLFRLINLAFLGPLLAAIVSTLVPMLMGGPLSRSERKLLEAAERRIETVKHLISEIRNIRFGNLQCVTERQATKGRKLEIEAATAFRRILTIVVIVAISLSSVAILAAFGGFSLLPHGNLDFTILFTSLSTMQIMLTPLLSIVQMLPALIGSVVSWKRLVAYLKVGEDVSAKVAPLRSEKSALHQNQPIEMDTIDSMQPAHGLALRMHNMTAQWADDSFVANAELSLADGRLAIVAGVAGSGKSSLLKTVLGETTVSQGCLEVRARKISICDQKLWFIPEMSIKENIIFGKPYNETLYNKVLVCCCLDRDLRALDDGESTMLSVVGSPLSGGQRRRVSLARCLYDCGDLFLFDDIFNGLDTKTRNLVATNIFGSNGFLPELGATAIFCCTEPPSIMSSFANTEFYVLQSGCLDVVERSAVTELAADSEEGQSSQTSQAVESVQSPNVSSKEDEVADDIDVVRELPQKKLAAHRAFFKSFGSPVNIALVAIFLFAYVGLDRASSFWLSHWTSQYSKLQAQIDNGYYIGIYAAIAAASILAAFISVWVHFMRVIPDSSISLHKQMLSVLVKTPAFTVEQNKAETVNRFTNDIEAVDLDLPQALYNLVSATASSTGSLVVIGVGSPFTLISLPILMPLVFFLQRFYLASSFQLRSLQVAEQAPMLEMISATLEGRVTIRAFRQDQYMARLISDRICRAMKMNYLFRSAQTWVILMLSLLNGCVAIALASLLIGLGGSKSVTWGGLALVNVIRLGQDTMLLLHWWTTFESSMASMDRIYNYTMATPQEHIAASNEVVGGSWPEHGNVQLNNVSLNYRTRRIVKNVSFEIAPGTKLAILGRTGSGKTSLLQSFFGLIRNAGGTIEVDGVDLAAVEGDTVQSRFVGHPQTFIPNLSTTVRYNLDISGAVPDARIREVLSRLATPHMTADIMSRLDSKWNECSFSDGWQRIIGIARTLLRESTVYVMDEPTSGMDESSHIAAMDAIFNILSEKTVITTTHTLVGISRFGRVVILDDGQLVEQGSPTELLQDDASWLNQLIKAD